MNTDHAATDLPLLQMVHREMNRARAAFPENPSYHHAYGVLMEEVREFEAEIFRKEFQPERIVTELVQVAAVALRAASEIAVPTLPESGFIRLQLGADLYPWKCPACGSAQLRKELDRKVRTP